MAVQDDDVIEVLGETDISDFSTFIEAAKRLYDNELESKTVGSDAYDDVVAHLAAHLVAAGPERQVGSASEGSGRVSFEGDTGMGLRLTTYGQLAMTLDPHNVLANASAESVSFDVVDLRDDEL